jgi:hypothetical protein
MLAMRHGVELMDTTNLLSKGSRFQNDSGLSRTGKEDESVDFRGKEWL